jgi:hypothetical protein
VLTWPGKLLPVLLFSTNNTLFNIAFLPLLPCLIVLGFLVELRLQPLCHREICFISGVLGSELPFEFTSF